MLHHTHQGILVNSLSQLISLALDDYANTIERLSEGLEIHPTDEEGDPRNVVTNENNWPQ